MNSFKLICSITTMLTLSHPAWSQVTQNAIENVVSVEITRNSILGKVGLGYAVEQETQSYIRVTCRNAKTRTDYECASVPAITQIENYGLVVSLVLPTPLTLGAGFGFKNFEGKTLRDFFGAFWGVEAGYAFVGGGRTNPFMINSQNIIAHNALQAQLASGELNISAAKFDVKWDAGADDSFVELLDKPLIMFDESAANIPPNQK